MKKILFILSLLTSSLVYAQKDGGGGPGIDPKILAQIKYTPTPGISATILCTPVSLNGCNYISNNNFTPSSSYNPLIPDHLLNAFQASPGNLVPGWVASHGTPQITDGIYDFSTNTWLVTPSTPPSPATGYAYSVTIPDAFNPYDEGFAQKIPNLVSGKKYFFSFFDKLQTWGYSGLSLESFNIVLLHCADATSIFTYPGATTPNFPVNSQKIVCHNNVTTNWQRYTTSFVANDDYDVIVFYPKNQYSPAATAIGVSLAYPELIDVQGFSAGPTPTPEPGNCTVTIGPLTPNCGVVNAVFTWHGPNGLPPIIAPPNQQIQVDASNPLNVGTWTLTMTVPGALTPNGGCSMTPMVSATVTIPNNCIFTPILTGQWTWMHGDNTSNQLGVYGTQGVPSSTNKPGARERAVTWTDASGNMWLFGGIGFSSTGTTGYLNDLWKYNKTTNEWAWLKGSNTCNQLGVYGTQTVSSPSNSPGARNDGETWTDASGNLWLFGGRGFNSLSATVDFNDVWKYDVTTNEWTWMKGGNVGNELPVFGTQGTPAAANTPCARSAAVNWIDASGNIWLFGGVGGGFGFCSDLWKYDPISNQWTWMHGDNISNQASVYGTVGVSSPSNKPGSRASAIGWADANGNLWMFGGVAGHVSGPSALLNDLWKYNISNNQWTWVKGDNIVNQQGNYGTVGVSVTTNKPGARFSSANWVDPNGIFWLFGGTGLATSSSFGDLDDLWAYNTATNEWVWTEGTNSSHLSSTTVYGTQGIPGPTTTPGARIYSASWIKSDGNLWLFGGRVVTDQRNDLWRYHFCTGCKPGVGNKTENFSNKNFTYQEIIGKSESKFFNGNGQNHQESLLSNIQSLEIYNTAGQLLKKVSSDLEAYDVLRNSKTRGLIPNLYFIRILYKDKTSKTIKQFLQ